MNRYILMFAILISCYAPHSFAAGTTFSGARFLGDGEYPRLADLDNDGDLDIMALKNISLVGGAIYTPIWLENQGTTFTAHTIIDWNCATIYLEPADLDGDGDMDLILGCAGIFKYTDGIALAAWLENDGAKPPHFTPHSLFNSPANCSKRSLCAADMDNDGDLDVVAAFANGDRSLVLWYENDGGRPPRFTSHTLAQTYEPFSNMLMAVDLDGDGWRDVVMGTHYWGTRWFKNSRRKDVPFPEYPVCYNRGQLAASDLNGDGRPDVLAGFGWNENRGGTPTSFTTHSLASGFRPVSFNNGEVAVGDLDGDGHPDAVSYDPSGQASVGQQLCWFQNDGKASPTFILHALGSSHLAPRLGDLTGDGTPEIVCSGVACYLNQAALRPLTILSPTESGRSYASGGKMEIYWRSDPKTAGTAVRLELWRGNAKVASLGSSWSATGQGHAQVTLPRVASSWNYRIKAVSAYAPGQYWDFSDEPFAIRGKGNGVKPVDWGCYP